MAARTVNDLVNSILRGLGVYNPSESVDAADADTCLHAIQDILAEWAGDGLMVPFITQESPITLIVGTASYTVGEYGSPSLNTVRPEKVVGAFVRSSSIDYYLTIIGEREYRLIQDKTTGGSPDRIYVQYTVPNLTLYLYPVPDAADALYLNTVKAMTDPAALTGSLANAYGIPRSYFSALKWNVMLEVAAEYEKQPTPLMAQRAVQTKAALAATNLAKTLEPARLEIAPGGETGNILDGWQ